MTPAQFIAMLDAATPEELGEIGKRLVGPVMDAEMPAKYLQERRGER